MRNRFVYQRQENIKWLRVKSTEKLGHLPSPSSILPDYTHRNILQAEF